MDNGNGNLGPEGNQVRDRTLIILVGLATILSLGHDLDHVARGDLRWPLTWASLPFLVVLSVIYTPIGIGLYLYRKGTVGPGYWAILAGVGVVFGWLAHFSPFTDQPARSILAAYESAAAGRLAVACLIALMLVLIATAIYAAWMWVSTRGRRLA